MTVNYFNVIRSLAITGCFVCCSSLQVVASTMETQSIITAVEDMRKSFRDMAPVVEKGENVMDIRNIKINGTDPAHEIPLRIYLPLEAKQQQGLPIFLFIHGGGFVAGDLDSYDNLLRAITNKGKCIVVSVDYRLAPEHPFPAGLDDSYTALQWVYEKAITFGGDPTKIVVGGDSAGGNLTAALTILTRDRKGPMIQAQWLMYPTLSNKMDTDSWAKLGDKYFPTREAMDVVINAYVPKDKSPYDPLISPLNAKLEHLPQALVQVGGLDPLNSEGKDFVDKLKQNGIEAQFILYPESQHGFLQFYQDKQHYPGADNALMEGITWLKGIFNSIN